MRSFIFKCYKMSKQLIFIYLLIFFSSGIIWEMAKDVESRFKPIQPRDSYGIECAYQKYKDDSEMQPATDPIVVINNKMQVCAI